MMIFNNKELRLYDERCEFARNVNSFKETDTYEALKAQIRIKYESIENGGEQRIIEQLLCPENMDCEDWDRKEKKIFDDSGRLILEENGSYKDFFRQIISIDYQADRTVFTFSNLRRTNDVGTQTLLSRDVNTFDLEGNILSRKRFEPLSFDELKYQYDENDLLKFQIFDRTEKDSLGLHNFIDTSFYSYQFFCDNLLAEQIITYSGGFQTKTIYSYLLPADCGEKTIINEFTVYPNPTNSSISFTNTAFVTGVFDLEIYDMTGRKIRTYNNVRSETQTLNVGDLPNGIYQLSINQENNRISQSFIVQR